MNGPQAEIASSTGMRNATLDIQAEMQAEEVSSGNSSLPSDDSHSHELAFVSEFLEKDQTLIYGSYNFSAGNLGASSGTISDILFQALPKRKKKKIQRAYDHAEKDDLLSCLIETLVDFTTVGFDLAAQPPVSIKDGSEKVNEEFHETLRDTDVKLDSQKIVDDLVRDWYISDSMILYWRIDVDKGLSHVEDDRRVPDMSVPDDALDNEYGIPGLLDIAVLNPGDVDWNNTLGMDILTVDIPETLYEIISKALMSRLGVNIQEIYKDLNAQGVPKRWVDAVREGRRIVQLRRDEGDNWLIETKARKYNGLAVPTMYTIYLDLEMRKMLKEGDVSAALMMKHFIMLIKQGESITTGPLAGATRNWLQPGDAKTLLKRFSSVNKAMRAAVNHTTVIEFVFPPKEMFDGAKYLEPEKRLFSWAGVSSILITGGGGKYASGFLSVKRMIGKMKKCREKIDRMMMMFFLHPTIFGRLGTPKGYRVTANFDTNVLKDPKQLLDEVKFLFEAGLADPRTAINETERDPDTIKASAIQSKKEQDQGHWQPPPIVPAPLPASNTKNPNAGGGGMKSTKSKGGRPANEGTQTGQQTREQSPRAQNT